jgi:DNA-binding GntR family transcriptional regulator
VIETLLGLRIQRGRLSIRLEQVSRAGAKHLGMNSAASVMILERTSYVAGDKACEHTLFEIRPDGFEFVLDSEGGPRPADSGGRTGKQRKGQSSASNA